MSIISLPFVGYLSLPLLLTSLIIGVVILIFFERRRKAEERRPPVKPVSNGLRPDEGREPSAYVVRRPHGEGAKSQDASSDKSESSSALSTPADNGKVSAEKASQEGTSSCSSSEEEASKPEGRKLRTRRKHSCGGAKTCSKKVTVSKVLIVTDAENEELKDSLEDLAEKLKTGGLTCTTRFLQGAHQPLLRVETSQLLIFLVTSDDSCEKIQDIVMEMMEAPESMGAFIYSVACLTESSQGDVCEAAERLNAALSELGGSEWLPLSCVTQTTETDDPAVVTSHQYINKILQKVKKQSRKCCGTSCSSKKATDIEDLAASLLPVVTPVKT